MSAASEFEKLRVLFPDAQLMQEGGVDLAFLPRLVIDNRGNAVTMPALLWPKARDSYPTRLFLERQLAAPQAQNWNSFGICTRTWWACSWHGVPESLSWPEMIANHLRAFK